MVSVFVFFLMKNLTLNLFANIKVLVKRETVPNLELLLLGQRYIMSAIKNIYALSTL